MKDHRKIALIMIDIFLINFSYIISFQLVRDKYNFLYSIDFLKYGVVITLAYIICFYFSKLYESIWTQAGLDEFLFALQGWVVGSVIAFIVSFSKKEILPINVNIIAVALVMASILGVRIFFRIYRRIIIKFTKVNKEKQSNVLIIGAGSAGTMILKELKEKSSSVYNVVGFIDDDKVKINKWLQGVKVLGDRNNILEVSKKFSVDIIIFSIPTADIENKKNIMNICKTTGCKLKTVPSLYEIINGKIHLNNIKNVEVEDLLGRDEIKLDTKSISEDINGKIVMVTGGGGSIGSELCRQIAKFKPKQLIILDIYENNAYDIQNELIRNFESLNLKVLIGSVRDKKRLNQIFESYSPEIIFHAAAHKHVPLMEDSPAEAIKNNIFGTWNLVDLSNKYGVKKFVLISTDKAVNPTNVMGATKRFCEMIVQAMDKNSETEFVAVRFGNVLGSNGSVIPLFKKQIEKGGPITVTSKNITRFFMTIPEASQLVLQAGAIANGGEIFILDMGKPVKIYDLACDLIRLSGYEPNKDIKIQVTGLRPGEKMYEELLMDEEGLQKTKHQKIKIGKSMDFSLDDIKNNLDSLNFVVQQKNQEMIIEKLKELVPTYKASETENTITK